MFGYDFESKRNMIDYRTTFLRWHIQSEKERISDILPLRRLRERLRGRVDEMLLRKLTNPHEFFYRWMSDEPLYLPIRLLPERDKPLPAIPGACLRGDENVPPRDRILTLTRLIRHLDAAGERGGIVLVACSGAGKTLACRKAFFDCLRIPPVGGGMQLPPIWGELAGYVPCVVTETEEIKAVQEIVKASDDQFERALDAADSSLVLHMLAAAARVPGVAPEGLVSQLQTMFDRRLLPRLLLIFDLNSLGQRHRRVIVRAILAFQRLYRDQGHRCLVTYRSTEANDVVMKHLRDESHDDRVFRFCDMQPVESRQAEQYLERYSEYESWVYGSAGIGQGPTADEPRRLDYKHRGSQLEKLKAFVQAHARGSDSLISTALIMHFVASLDPDTVARRVHTLADLYREVVKNQLKYDQDFYGKHLPDWFKDQDDGEARILVACARVALLMQARKATRLSRAEALDVMTDETHANAEWWPQGESGRFWRRGAYYRREWSASRESAKRLLEFGLFRQEDRAEQSNDDSRAIAFLHDSFVEYLTGAVALRQYTKPEPAQPGATSGLPEQWFREVVTRMSTEPYAWMSGAEFLGGSLLERASSSTEATHSGADEASGARDLGGANPGSYASVHRLAHQLITAEPKAGMASLLRRMLIGAQGQSDPICRSLTNALDWHGSVVRGQPETLAQECYNYLSLDDCWLHDDLMLVRDFGDRLLEQLRNHGRPWLRAVYGAFQTEIQMVAEDSAGVCALAALQDGGVAWGTETGSVNVWDCYGRVLTMSEHVDRVSALTTLPDGRIVSGSADNTVKLWDPARRNVLSMAGHTSSIMCLAALDDGCIVSGDADGGVIKWDPIRDLTRSMPRRFRTTYGIGILSEGRVVVFGKAVRDESSDSPMAELSENLHTAITVWNAETDEVEQRPEVTSPVTCMSVIGGWWVASGHADGTITVWDPRTNSVVALGGSNGEVNFLREFPPHAVAFLCGGRTVGVWCLETKEVKTMQRDADSCAEYGFVAVGFARVVLVQNDKWKWRDPELLVWAPSGDDRWRFAVEIGKTWELTPYPGLQFRSQNQTSVTSAVVLRDGRVGVGTARSAGGDVLLWDPSRIRTGRSHTHRGRVGELAVLDDKTVVSQGPDGIGRRNQIHERAWMENRPCVSLTCVIGDSDGDVIVGWGDGLVQFWSKSGDLLTVTQHPDSVRAIAVAAAGHIVSISKSTFHVWDLRHPAAHAQLPNGSFPGEACGLALMPNGHIVSANSDKVEVYDPISCQVVAERTCSSIVRFVTPLEDGRVVLAANDGSVELWNPTKKQVWTMPEHFQKAIGCYGLVICALQNGRVACSSGGWIAVWDPIASASCLWKVEPRVVEDYVFCWSLLADGRQALGCRGGAVKIWDPTTNAVCTIGGHAGGVRSLAVLDDGRFVSGGQDGTVSIWDMATESSIGYKLGEVISVIATHPCDPYFSVGTDVGGVFDFEIEPHGVRRPGGFRPSTRWGQQTRLR